MRLVRLDDVAGGFSLDLHPQLTVVSGLAAPTRERLVAAVAGVPRGAEPGLGGRVEVHGVLLDLGRATLDLLELHHDVDVVLRAGDLPGGSERLTRWRGEAAASTPVAVPEAGTDDEPVVAARRRLAEAESERSNTSLELLRVRNRLRDVGLERSGVLGRLESARSRLDPFALAGLKVARDELDASEQRAATPRDDGAADRAVAAARLEQLRGEHEGLRRLLGRLRSIDTSPVRQALDQLVRARRPVSVPAPRAQQLLGEWNQLQERRAMHEARRAGSRSHLAEVTARRDQAYDELVEAEQALRAPQLDTRLVDELEMVHDELFELDGRTGKIGGAKLRRRIEELRIQESRLLAQLGFDTWSSYVMGVSQGGADLQRAHRFQVAQAAYQLAEEELARAAMSPVVDDPEAHELAELERLLRSRVVEVLGHDPGPDPTVALAEARAEVPATPESDLEVLVAHLGDALVATGVELPGTRLGPAEMESLAGGWLDAMAALPERIARAEADLAAVEREGTQLRAQLDRPASTTTGPSPDGPELEAARARLAEAEARAAAHEAAAEEIAALQAGDADLGTVEDDLRREAEVLARRVEAAEAAVGAAAEALRAAREDAQARAADSARLAAEPFRLSAGAAFDAAQVPDRDDVDADAVEWYVLARMAQQRALSFVGSVPMVVDDALAPWPFEEIRPVLARLERMSEVIQVVYLTDDPDVVSWARSLGEEHATVIEATPVG